MIIDENIADKAAELLLQINAIKLNSKNPFTWASGWKSPIYCDNRLILSYPPIRNFFKEEMGKFIDRHYGKPDLIAGVATGAIGIGVLVAEYLGIPFVYVRPEPKGHGRKNQIEGHASHGQSCVVIEDLISTGKSSMLAVHALKDSGIHIKGMVAIFSYEFEVSKQLFDENHIDLFTLSNYDYVLQHALKSDYIKANELLLLEQWKLTPQSWQPQF